MSKLWSDVSISDKPDQGRTNAWLGCQSLRERHNYGTCKEARALTRDNDFETFIRKG